MEEKGKYGKETDLGIIHIPLYTGDVDYVYDHDHMRVVLKFRSEEALDRLIYAAECLKKDISGVK